MTITETLIAIRALPHMTAKFDHQTREYRVAYRSQHSSCWTNEENEASAYYTTDADDAFATARHMSNQRATAQMENAYRQQNPEA